MSELEEGTCGMSGLPTRMNPVWVLKPSIDGNIAQSADQLKYGAFILKSPVTHTAALFVIISMVILAGISSWSLLMIIVHGQGMRIKSAIICPSRRTIKMPFHIFLIILALLAQPSAAYLHGEVPLNQNKSVNGSTTAKLEMVRIIHSLFWIN
jgi:hypothetical protein